MHLKYSWNWKSLKTLSSRRINKKKSKQKKITKKNTGLGFFLTRVFSNPASRCETWRGTCARPTRRCARTAVTSAAKRSWRRTTCTPTWGQRTRARWRPAPSAQHRQGCRPANQRVEVSNSQWISCLDSSLGRVLACGAGGRRFAPRPWHVYLGALLEDEMTLVKSLYKRLFPPYLSFNAYYFLKQRLHHFSKIKSHKEVTKQ